MNNEPVAYLFKTDQDYAGDVVFPDEVKETEYVYKKEGWEYQLIPLYTAPRELSDEEIYELMNDVPTYEIGIGELYQFARAILRKAQEK